MSPPSVSAVIVTYNYGRFIEEAIESVLTQDIPACETEVIVVDDGSTDDTPERVEKYGDRIRYLRKENGGEASALNAACGVARGEIVALLEADDLWLPGKLRRVCEAFEKQPEAGMVYHPYEIWDTRKDECRRDEGFLSISGCVPARLVDLLNYDVSGTSVLSFRRRSLQTLLPIPADFRTCVDAYLAHLIIFVAPVVAVKEYLTKYRKHGQNESGYDESDLRRLESRWHYAVINAREITAWLERHGYDLRRPEMAAYVKRWQLWEEMCRFAWRGAGRLEFFSHLREHQALYGQLWSPGYRLFKSMANLAGLVLGYDGFRSFRDLYGHAAWVVSLRKLFFPRYSGKDDGSGRTMPADRGALW